MHKNQIWLAFLSTTLLVVLWFTAVTGYELYNYFAMNSKTLPTIIEWSVKGKSSDRYFLQAKYQYRVNDSLYDGETGLDNTTYRNTIAAEKALKDQKERKWYVRYASRNPENSNIQYLFPLKSCFYAGILWGLLLYFVWLGFYVGKFRTQPISKD